MKINHEDTCSCENCGSNTNLEDDISGTKVCEECESCSVCLEYFSKQDKQFIKFSDGCSHSFCKSCTDSFLDVKCPICRYNPPCYQNKNKIDTIEFFEKYLQDNKLKPLKYYKMVAINTDQCIDNCNKYNTCGNISCMEGESVANYVKTNFVQKKCDFYIEHYKDRVLSLVCNFNCGCCKKMYKIAEY